jgi:hypothetical protein
MSFKNNYLFTLVSLAGIHFTYRVCNKNIIIRDYFRDDFFSELDLIQKKQLPNGQTPTHFNGKRCLFISQFSVERRQYTLFTIFSLQAFRIAAGSGLAHHFPTTTGPNLVGRLYSKIIGFVNCIFLQWAS